MQRATRWLLSFLEEQSVPEDQPLEIKALKFDPLAQQQLLRRLNVRGQWFGGALFGTLQGDLLTVALITTLGPPGMTGQPINPSLPFLIGASQTMAPFLGDAVDWVGQWIVAPDGRLPEKHIDLLWLTLGARRGLFDERHPLVVVGLQDDYLVGRAYLWEEGESIEVQCSLGPFSG